MLHVVQVVLWGVAEAPRLFLDEAKARAALVEEAKRHWTQRYAAYCEHHGLSGEDFAAARAFVGTIDVSEKSGIHCWTFSAQELGLSEPKGPLGPEELRQIAQEVAAVKTGLARLLDDLSRLTDRLASLETPPEEAPGAGGPETAAPSPAAVRQEEPEPDAAARATPEWKAFVGAIKRLASGVRNEFYLLNRDDWRQEVYGSRTSLEYWDWVADRLRKYQERAKSAGYSVIEEPESPGCFRFANPEGIACEDGCNSEWEAWCAAGIELEGRRRDGTG